MVRVFPRTRDNEIQRVVLKRWEEKVVRPSVEGRQIEFDILIGADDNDIYCSVAFIRKGNYIGSGAVRQGRVRKNQVGLGLRN